MSALCKRPKVKESDVYLKIQTICRQNVLQKYGLVRRIMRLPCKNTTQGERRKLFAVEDAGRLTVAAAPANVLRGGIKRWEENGNEGKTILTSDFCFKAYARICALR